MPTFTFVLRGPGTTRNMKLNCQVECNANKDGSERKLLEIFGEIVTMMEREGAQSDGSQSQDNKSDNQLL